MHIVVADVDMFRAFLSDRIRGDKNQALVISANWDWLKAVAELPHKGVHPDYLVTAIRQSHVFGFSA